MPPPLPIATIRTEVPLPLQFADGYAATARIFSFDELVDGQENLAFGLGDRVAAVTSAERVQAPLVRLHSECLMGDVFGSQRCDCGAQLREAVERFGGRGVPVPAAGGAWHRPVRQARRLRAAGHGAGHV